MACLQNPSDTCPNSDGTETKKLDPIYFTLQQAFHFCDWRQCAYQLHNYQPHQINVFIALSCLHRSPPVPPSLSLPFILSLSARQVRYQKPVLSGLPRMLVEKLICNARLNLLILHPFPAPSQLPQQTGAQQPIYTEVPRNKNIYLQKEGERGEETERETKRGTECRPTCHSFGQLGGGGGVLMFPLALPIPTPDPSPLQTFIYWHYTFIYQSASKICHTPQS